MIHKRGTALARSVKRFTGGLHGDNLTINSYVDQDT